MGSLLLSTYPERGRGSKGSLGTVRGPFESCGVGWYDESSADCKNPLRRGVAIPSGANSLLLSLF